MAEYTPSEDDVRAWCRDGTGDYPDVMDAWITRFLTRVRRDAAREELLDLAEDYRLRAEEALSDEDFNLASTLTGHFLTIRERALAHYPETED